jgi:copper chaperone CopZ
MTVERLFSQIDGVEEAEVDLKTGIVDVKSNKKIGKEQLERALEDSAYKIEKIES